MFNVYLPINANDNYSGAQVQGELIEGNRVHLKQFGIEDADFLHRWNNDPEYSGPYEPFEPVTREELLEWLPREKIDVLWYIIEITGGEKVGQIVARLQDDGSYQVGFRVVPLARNRGHCTLAMKTLVEYLFRTGVERIEAEANPANMPSRRVLEKVGFRQISYKERFVEVNGVWLDGIVYELRRS